MILVAMIVVPVLVMRAEVCLASPEPKAAGEEQGWHWRMIDGKKCWHKADRLLPKEELFWEYGTDQYDTEEGATVKERKYYVPGDLREQVESPDSSHKKQRWERRHRRERERGDDDD